MNNWKMAVEAKTAEFISKGVLPEVAARRARKACKHLHPAHKRATLRNLKLADTRYDATTKVDSYNRV